MKKSPSLILLTLFTSYYAFAQDRTIQSTSEDVEYEEVEEFERKFKTIFEEQSFEYEYESTSPSKSRSRKGQYTKNKTYVDNSNEGQYTHRAKNMSPTKYDRSINEIDSIWKNELYSNNLYDEIYNDVQNYDTQNTDFNELSTETLISRLEALNEKTPFNIEYNPILENVIKKYLKTRKKSFERLIKKSHYYFPLFEKELDQYQIPMEIKYLAIVESALNPRIKSPVGATGLWQFMYQTGKMHHLKVNSYIDERMDPLKSTKAACEYLSSLYKVFSDWDLALAAYNSGPGNVIKAIRRARGKKNYWNIRSYLPKETAGYLPAFLATMYMFEYANEHGLKNNTAPKYVYFETDTIKIKKKVTFREISKAIDIEIKELSFLNPSFKLGIIPKSTKNPYSLRLPLNKISDFITYEDKLYNLVAKREDDVEKSMYHNYSKTKKFTYKVRSGDYLGKIAARFNTSVSLLKSWNNLRSNTIRVGQKLTIYHKETNKSKSQGPKKIAYTK